MALTRNLQTDELVPFRDPPFAPPEVVATPESGGSGMDRAV